MRMARKTKKTIRWTLDGGDAFQVVELVKFMEDALKKPNQRYQIKIKIKEWDNRACRNFEKQILNESHWDNLNFRYSKLSKSFLFTRN
jgi:hypothetical protein